MMAFAVEDYLTGESKLDPRYVKWAATFIKIDIGRNELKSIPLHPCTDEDFDQFYPVDKRSTRRLNAFKTMPEKQMFCLDWQNTGAELYGENQVTSTDTSNFHFSPATRT